MTGKYFDIRIIVLFDEQMSNDTPFSGLIEYGVSNELRGLIAAMEDATCMDRSPRYTQATIYELRRKLLCYNYGTAYYEVAHLLAIVTHFGDGFAKTFWNEEALQGGRLRHLTERWPAQDSLTAGSTLSVNLNDRKFDFNWSRTNMIAAWTEFLYLIPRLGLENLLAPFNDNISGKQIDRLASELQKQTYSYLKDHLQPQNQFRECWQFLKWLKDGEEASSDYLNLLNDEKVLTLWSRNADDDLGDYRKFVSVGELAYDVLRKVAAGEQRRQLSHPASLSMDDWINNMGNGEFSPDEDEVELFRLCDAETDEAIPATEQLASDELASIKCLTGTDILGAKLLERPDHELNRLPQTHIRMHLFGKHQASITGDMQNHQGSNLPELIACAGVRAPTEWDEELKSLVTKINEARSAIAHILIEADDPAALLIIVDLNPGKDLFSQEADVSLTNLPEEVVQRSASCYKSINRQGFKAYPGPDILPAYVLADQQLSRLTLGFKTLEPMIINYQDHFESDRVSFSATFKRLYDRGT